MKKVSSIALKLFLSESNWLSSKRGAEEARDGNASNVSYLAQKFGKRSTGRSVIRFAMIDNARVPKMLCKPSL